MSISSLLLLLLLWFFSSQCVFFPIRNLKPGFVWSGTIVGGFGTGTWWGIEEGEPVHVLGFLISERGRELSISFFIL